MDILSTHEAGTPMRPLQYYAADVPGHPSAWVSVLLFPKIEISAERIQSLLDIWEEQGVVPHIELGEKDILLLIEPSVPAWVPRIVENFLSYIQTGETGVELHDNTSPS